MNAEDEGVNGGLGGTSLRARGNSKNGLGAMKGFIGARQTTLAGEISITGTGVHSGAPVSISLYPADGDTGLRFLLSNGDAESTEITADQRYVTGVTLCTVLGDGNGASVATVEHLLAALRGLGVDNALIEIEFDCAMIGRQRIEIDLNPGSFRRELSRARTFGFMKDVERLWAAGLAL